MNKIIVSGFITKGREGEGPINIRKYDQEGKPTMATFSISQKKPGENKGYLFFNVVVYNGLCEKVVSNFTAGSNVLVCGRIDQSNYTNKNNVQSTSEEVIAESVDAMKEYSTQQQSQPGPQYQAPPQQNWQTPPQRGWQQSQPGPQYQPDPPQYQQLAPQQWQQAPQQNWQAPSQGWQRPQYQQPAPPQYQAPAPQGQPKAEPVPEVPAQEPSEPKPAWMAAPQAPAPQVQKVDLSSQFAKEEMPYN